MDWTFEAWPAGPLGSASAWPLPTPTGTGTGTASAVTKDGLAQYRHSSLSTSPGTYSSVGSYSDAGAPVVPLVSAHMDRETFVNELQGAFLPAAPSQPFSSPPIPVEVVFDESTSWQHKKSAKRKEQNKRSQQAYRARKEHYRRSLEGNVDATTASLRKLRDDNSKLLQALCDLRTENRDLRCRRHSSSDGSYTSQDINEQIINDIALIKDGSTGADGPESKHYLSQHALESLHDPLQAMQNLLSSHLGRQADRKDLVAAFERMEHLSSS